MKATIITFYENYKGGMNNLQISQVISPSKSGGVYNIHKIFRSTKNLAENKAKKYCEFLNK